MPVLTAKKRHAKGLLSGISKIISILSYC